MSRDYKLYLRDILKSVEKIESFVAGLDEEAFVADAMRSDSTPFNLMTIGEAAKNIPSEIRELMPEIEWGEIGRFRDFVAHHYFGLHMDKVWGITQSDLPELRRPVELLLQKLDSQETDES